MDISYNWLKEYVPVEVSPEQLAEILTMGGLEVEEIEHRGAELDGVVVGEVLEVNPHPNADRLTLCRVDFGDGPVQIACGAPNVAAGQKVPVATVGTTLMLPDRDDPSRRLPVKIRKAKIRGEVSEGMICAEDELGLSEDHSGIMVLREDAEVGTPFGAYLRSQGVDPVDAILDVSITPNRPDATSHIGVARDVAALTGSKLSLPSVTMPENGGDAAEQVTIQLLAPELCPRYVAMLVRGVTVRESPEWLKRRLTAIGLRPRNNVVDVTNFVLHECGQPLHAFDFDQIADATIRVRQTDREIPFVTLDDKERTLPAGTLMIADGERDVAVAGVMGGENSEVSRTTTNVLIESAYFQPASIRRTARALGLQTDASYRFERGVDRDGQVWAAARAAALIAELGGGTIVPGMVDAHPIRPEPRRIDVRAKRVDALLGTRVHPKKWTQLLKAIGFQVDGPGTLEAGLKEAVGEQLTFACTVPTFRPDVEREVDVIEEVARLYGYDNIPEPARAMAPGEYPTQTADDRLRTHLRHYLSSLGYREIYTNSMQRTSRAAQFNHPVLTGKMVAGEIVETLNPISQEMAALRTSLLPGALDVIAFNRKHGRRILRFFEFGHVFHRSDAHDTIVDGYAEHESLILAASGLAVEAGWDTPARAIDLFDLKGIVTALLDELRIPSVSMTACYDSTDVTRHHLDVESGGTRIGLIAELSPEIGDQFDLESPVYFAELDFATLVALAAPQLDRKYRPVSRYPAVERDIAVLVDRSREAGPMLDAIREAGGELLKDVGIFDLYEDERVGKDRKSVAFSLRFAADRTLTDEEVDARVTAILEALARRHGAELRG